MATNEKQSGFMRWYESYQGKKVVNTVYSAGASVVIVGALFKILHWPGASYVLMAGMFTEAFLFIIGVFEKPHPEFHWENVFPQLLEFGTKPELLEEKATQPRPTLLGAGVEGKPAMPMGGGIGIAAPVAAAAAAGPNLPAVSDEEAKSFKSSIAELAKTAKQLAGAGEAAEKLAASYGAADASIQGLTQNAQVCQQNMAVVGTSLQNMAVSAQAQQQSFDAVGASLQSVAATAQAYQQNIEAVGAKVGSLNSLYELQINSINAQNQISAALAKDLQTLQANTTVAAKSSEAYSAGAQQLAQQVASLNQVYGNMLNALA
ncbi:MAG: gliding motility protein GldL [Paludibacteraceae bacterium]|nr:gliding motility protein GldL [Paludibacteraceae bacterium]